MFEWFCEFNLKLKLSKCSFFQSEIVYLAHHLLQEGICPSQDNVHAIEEFPMLETYTQVHTFCGLKVHYRHFIKGFTHIVWPLYSMLGKEVKMGLVQLLPEVHGAVRILKDKIKTMPMLVFPDFDKPFLLETDTTKEGLGTVLSEKQDDGHYHPVAFGIHSLTPSENNYHSSKIKFLTLTWSVTEHFKDYLACMPFVVKTDNNPLTYVLTTPNLNATGHRWVGALASFEFMLEYQKVVMDALSHVPICHNHKMVWSLLEGTIMGAMDRGEAEASKELPGCSSHQDVPHAYHGLGGGPGSGPYVGSLQEVTLYLQGYTIPKRDALLRKYLGDHANTEEGHALFCVQWPGHE